MTTITSSESEPPVPVSVETGTAVHALVDLRRLATTGDAPGELADALDRIGDPTGETWLHLLGLCLELEPPRSLRQLIEHVSALDPATFRKVLLGTTAWSWRSIVGADTLDAAAHGNADARARLLSDDRYYGGVASQALPRILPLGAEETRSRFVTALLAYEACSDSDRHGEALAATAARIASRAEREGWLDTIEDLTGYRYVFEPEARRVVVMPHFVDGGLILAQHDEVRLIVYGQATGDDPTERIFEAASALADRSRLLILAHLRGGSRQLAELVDASGLTRSTVHHHLRQLRAAGLVAVEGNARAYRYRISHRGSRAAISAMSELLELSFGPNGPAPAPDGPEA